jgi:hypothetical protein
MYIFLNGMKKIAFARNLNHKRGSSFLIVNKTMHGVFFDNYMYKESDQHCQMEGLKRQTDC